MTRRIHINFDRLLFDLILAGLMVVWAWLAIAALCGRHEHALDWTPAPGSSATAETFIADYAAALDAPDVEGAMRARGWVLACDECTEAR